MDIKAFFETYLAWQQILYRLKNTKDLAKEPLTEPFKTWYTEYKKTPPPHTTKKCSDFFNDKIFILVAENLITWHKLAIKQKLIESSKDIESLDTFHGEDEEKDICKLITTLLYKNKRHDLQEEPCIGICYYLILYDEYLISKGNLNQFLNDITKLIKSALEQKEKTLSIKVQNLLAQKENELGNYFGSYISDDSDSEDENTNKNSLEDEYNVYCAQQLLNKIEDYQPINTKGTLYVTKRADLPLPPRWRVNRANLTKEQFADLTKLNQLLQQGLSIPEALSQAKLKTKFFCAQYRGVAYGTRKWNQSSRKNHRDKKTNNEIGKPQFSTAVYKASKAYPFTFFFGKTPEERAKFNPIMEENAKKLEENLQKARHTSPVIYPQTRIGTIFNNQAFLMQHLYSNDYQKFHQLIKEGMFKDILINEENPLVSTGNVPKHALDYAYGNKYYEGFNKHDRLRPRWRSDGRAERPYSGKVYVSLHSIDEYEQDGPLDVPFLAKEGKISVINNILYERECSFPAWIKPGHVIAEHIAKYPSFNKEYKKIYLYKYGLSPELYELFKNAINASKPHSKENRAYKVLLGEWLSCYHEVRLIEEARRVTERNHGVLVYHNQDGSLGLEPDPPNIVGTSPGETNKKSREKLHDITVLRKELARIFADRKIFELNFKQAEEIIKKLMETDENYTEKHLDYLNEIFANKKSKTKSNPKSKLKIHFFVDSPEHNQNIVTSIDKKFYFEILEISGGLKGECGIIALPTTDSEQVYNSLEKILQTEEDPHHKKVLQLLGNDIMQLILATQPDIKLTPELQGKLTKLANSYLQDSSENNRKMLQQACSKKEICLSYIQDDLRNRNWISTGVIRAWALLNNQNIRIWQKQKNNTVSILPEMEGQDILKPKQDSNPHEILYQDGNHFNLLRRLTNEEVNQVTEDFSAFNLA